MSDDLLMLIKNSFGFDPAESQHHFLVDIPRGGDAPIKISEHLSWDDEKGSSEVTLGSAQDGQIRVMLARLKWDAIADEVRAQFNLRLKKMGKKSGVWRSGPNLVRRELGKELVLLAWAIEQADPALIPTALVNWNGLVPEERWWLYTQTAAATGHGVDGRGRGWRKAVRYALTENPVSGSADAVVPEYFRRANAGPDWNLFSSSEEDNQRIMTETEADQTNIKDTPLANAPSFIETQFPVAKVSMESYKERTAKQSQTLTGLGKWWGRKPLVLVRAALLGLLMPASDNPQKDREIFLKLMMMDADGLRLRKSKSIPQVRLLEELRRVPPTYQKRFVDSADGKVSLRRLSKEERDELQALVFERMTYAEKITYCDRPEQMDDLPQEKWVEINAHLGTQATNLVELVQELGEKRFGHRPRVGDAFCGGGSIPFEAARLGCDAYGSDLNPVAALLTWADLNIVGGGEDAIARVEKARKEIYEAVEKQVEEWGIERNSVGWRADAHLYCVEVTDPESGWKVPLMPSLIIGRKTNTIARLVPDPDHCRYGIEILQGVSDAEMEMADQQVTDHGSRVYPPGFSHSTPIEIIRNGLRMWESRDITPTRGGCISRTSLLHPMD